MGRFLLCFGLILVFWSLLWPIIRECMDQNKEWYFYASRWIADNNCFIYIFRINSLILNHLVLRWARERKCDGGQPGPNNWIPMGLLDNGFKQSIHILDLYVTHCLWILSKSEYGTGGEGAGKCSFHLPP